MSNDLELEDYANLEGTEYGEYCRQLVRIRQFNTDYGMGEEFSVALEKEIYDRLAYFEEHAVIKTETKTFTREVEILEWDNE